MSKHLLPKIVSLIAILFAAGSANATNVGGLLSSNTTWTTAGSPYVVTSDITVGSGVTLTVQPGVTVKLNQYRQIFIDGTLTAVGTPSAPIKFTAVSEYKSYAWRSIYFRSTASASQLSYVTVNYGGENNAATGYAAVVVNGSSPSFDHLTVSNSATHGINIFTAGAAPALTASTVQTSSWKGISVGGWTSPTITSTAILNNGDYAMETWANGKILGLTGMTATGNNVNFDRNGVLHRGGTITGSETWLPGLKWFLETDLNIGSSTNTTASLTIAAGTTVKIAQSRQVFVDGTLTAVGTPSAPIKFTAVSEYKSYAWRSIYFRSTASASQLSYVTVNYGGENNAATGYAAVVVNGSSPSFDHLTVSNSATHGINIFTAGAAPTLTASTVQTSSWKGISVGGWASPTITTTAILNNGDYAMEAWANARILGFTGMTATGNNVNFDRNGVLHRGGTITGSETWLPGLRWFLETDLNVGSSTNTTASLTIAAGTTVKIAQSRQIFVGGTLTAVGTPAARITLTAVTAQKNYAWRSIYLRSTASASRLSYVTLDYGGENTAASGYAAVVVDGSSPSFDHLTVSNSSTYGIRAGGNRGFTVTNSVFSGNTWGGVSNFTPTLEFQARLNYWSSGSGPSGQGAGSGQLVSTGVLFEPWLLAAPSQPEFVSSMAVANRTLNPANDAIFEHLDFATSLDGAWSVIYRSGAGTTVRSFSGNGTSGSLVWDGRNASGSILPNGTYTYEVSSTSTAGAVATIAHGLAIIDSALQVTLVGSQVFNPYFSPNGDGVQDVTTFSGNFSVDDVAWQVVVREPSGTIQRTYSGTGSWFDCAWDGLSDQSQLQPDGPYVFELAANLGSTSLSSAGSTTLDNTPPTALISSPDQAAVLSNVYQTTANNAAGTATDQNLLNWTLEYGAGASPATWTVLRSAITTSIVGGQLGTWNSTALVNGTYVLRLRVYDRAGNATGYSTTVTVGNFSASQSVQQFNGATGQAQTYTSIVPFPLAETITIKKVTGEVVRTLVNAIQRSAGTYNDVWNGRDDLAKLVPDGGYKYFATVTDGVHTFTWDLSSQFGTGFYNNAYIPATSWDPLNNKPVVITYNFPVPTAVTVVMSTSTLIPPNDCNPPRFCPVLDRLEESGSKKFYWAGVDNTGTYRGGDIASNLVVGRNTSFPENAVVVFGTKPTINSFTVVPPIFSPGFADQQLKVDFTSYQSEAVSVTITLMNMESRSVLRTITVPSQAPGIASIAWDGRADNGMLVAPGRYLYTATVRDPRGHEVTRQILGTVLY